MRSLYKYAVAALLFAVLSGCAFLAAPPGYHYDSGSFTQVPDDMCELQFVNKPDVLATINTSIGGPVGVNEKIVSIRNSSSTNVRNSSNTDHSLPESPVTCHVTLVFVDGKATDGVLTFTDQPNNRSVIDQRDFFDHSVSNSSVKSSIITWEGDDELAKKEKQQHEQAIQRERQWSEPFKFIEENMLALTPRKVPKTAEVPELTADQQIYLHKEQIKSALFIANTLGAEIFDTFLISEACDQRSTTWEIKVNNLMIKSSLAAIAPFDLTHKEFESIREKLEKLIDRDLKSVDVKPKDKVCRRKVNPALISQFDQLYDQAIADQVLPAVPRTAGFGLALKNAKETGNMQGEISFVATTCQMRSDYWYNTLNQSLAWEMTALDAKLTAAESDYVKTAMGKAMSSKVNEQLGPMGSNMMRNCQREVDSPSLQALDDLQYKATGNYH